ncbi:MAG: hypothetical protein ACI8V0_001496 [Pseudohongiellaceae bacterium]|jgi:hypothetical protein
MSYFGIGRHIKIKPKRKRDFATDPIIQRVDVRYWPEAAGENNNEKN